MITYTRHLPFSSAFSSLNCTRNRIPFEAFSYGFETIFVHSARCRQRIKCGHPLLIIPQAINHSTQNEKKNPKKHRTLVTEWKKTHDLHASLAIFVHTCSLHLFKKSHYFPRNGSLCKTSSTVEHDN